MVKRNIPKDICQLSNNEGLIQSNSTKLSKRPHERLEMIDMTRNIGINVKAPKEEPHKG